MKSFSFLAAGVLAGFLILNAPAVQAQAIDPAKSAKAAAISDTRFIANNIADNEDFMFLSRKALERGTDARVKEAAQQMLENHTAILYSLEQLQTAGTGSSKSAGGSKQGGPQAVKVNGALSRVSGTDFDSVWVSDLLTMEQAKYDELTQARETVTNAQLKMAIAESLPLVRKQVTQLKSIQKYLAKLALQRRKEAAAREKEAAARERERR